MAYDIFPGKVTVTAGAKTISNVKRIRWRRVHGVRPQTVSGTKLPLGFHQAHKWVEGELHVLSEATDALNAYINEAGDNTVITTFVANLTDADGEAWTATFTGTLITEVEEPYADEEDTVWVYRFVATQVVTAKT